MTGEQIYAWFISPIIMFAVCFVVFLVADRSGRANP